MKSVTAEIRQFFVKEGQKGPLVAAVSGGTDSTALLLALHEISRGEETLLAAHVNHHLRGTESDEDEAFVRELCGSLGVPLHVADGTLDPARVRERGIEAAAREIRYERLRTILRETGSRCVATAHQKNDQAETVLMRLLGGRGLAGLRGIHPVRNDGFVRPLLTLERHELEVFVRERGITPRHDRSNDDLRFLRNRVRVVLREVGGVDELARMAARAREQWPLLEQMIDDAESSLVVADASETRFREWPADLWLRAALLRRHIRRLDPAARDFDAQGIADEAEGIKRRSITRNLELVKKAEGWILRAPPRAIAPFELPLSESAPAALPQIGVTVRVARRPQSTTRDPLRSGRQLIELPRDARPAFTVRNRRRGDRFQPLGLPFSKKLKDFLIDRRIDVDLRDRLPLIVCNDEIAWIAGVEVSERFRVTGAGGDLYEVWTDDRDQTDLHR